MKLKSKLQFSTARKVKTVWIKIFSVLINNLYKTLYHETLSMVKNIPTMFINILEQILRITVSVINLHVQLEDVIHELIC